MTRLYEPKSKFTLVQNISGTSVHKSNMRVTNLKYSTLAVIVPSGISFLPHTGLLANKAQIILFRPREIHTSNYSQ